METKRAQSNADASVRQESFAVSAPSISLPKGGGAIRGIGEKFAANPVTGTGSMTVPIFTSPGRSGSGPQLALSYDSGSGNGPFGFGWTLPLPAITRKTEKGLPTYRDADEADVFLLSGAEDLVPGLAERSGAWVREGLPDRTVDGRAYRVQRYRPRIEGLFARIERWTSVDDPDDVHWRSISRDNILTLYGKDTESRIADSETSGRIFSWLICETRDDKGNAIVYRYKAEDGEGVDLTRVHERNRGDHDDARRTTNRYVKRVLYGNRGPLLDESGRRPHFLTDDQIRDAGWMFEVVFDYGEHDPDAPTPGDAGRWNSREDPFSSYRAGFEVRTYRLCERILMFHHFAGEEDVGADCLVRSTDFTYSHEYDPRNARNPVYTFLLSAVQCGYRRDGARYRRRTLPPIELEYSLPTVQDTVEHVDADSLEHLPVGLDGTAYQWTDLHGEGLPGILSEQGGAWFYKSNLSPISDRSGPDPPGPRATFAPVEVVSVKPSLALTGGEGQFMDLAGDGQPDVVVLNGPMPGRYEHDGEQGWQSFRPFTSPLNRDIRDPNLRFIDLDGDGHADVLITEDDTFVWHASLAEEGFGPARRVAQAQDEEKGPRLVFADGTQSVYLADLSGDGLTDLVRIRNGEVCYWPNLGYGRFGAKVTMDHAPHFDHPDQFDRQRIRLADIDGTGTTDIIYLHRDGVRLYFNQSGNSWSGAQALEVFPRIDELASIVPVDLLGNGTACLVWSSPLPADARAPMRYVPLMGRQKPHLLIKARNNLGAETEVQYAPSTKFYLADKRAGTPWLTKLPFPVHVVEKVTVMDRWRKTSFSTTYSYHHGYFDGYEREFRGFGRVEQTDVESFDAFAAGNTASPYITDDRTLYQPPVKTVTWFHTGAFPRRELALFQYRGEYFPNWFEARDPSATNVLGSLREHSLPEVDIEPGELTADEWRQAMRACKGTTLRQEVYELDVEALARGEEHAVRLFSATCRTCHVRILQPQAGNPHAVFLVTESEAINYHYELDLRPATLAPDPRIAHTFNLRIDPYGNVLQSLAIVYPRTGRHVDGTLPAGAEDLIARVQGETRLTYTETRYTNDIDDPASPEYYRLRVPCEVLTYDLTGVAPAERYVPLAGLRRLRLSEVHQTDGTPVAEIPYHEVPNRSDLQKRIVEHVRMLYFDANLRDPLPFGMLNHLGLPYETCKLALTEALLNAVFGSRLDSEFRANLADDGVSGYLTGTELAVRFPGADTTGQFWIRSGIPGFRDDAADHFFLAERYTDAFGNVTTLEFDERDLFIRSSTDPVGNTVAVSAFDYRLLAPRAMRDINGNQSDVAFDTLGLPAAMALRGKGADADHLDDLTPEDVDPSPTERARFFTEPYDEGTARRLLRSASARHLYDFGERINTDGSITWGDRPAAAAAILREQHVAAGGLSPLQSAFEYSDGGGSVLVRKMQAEPEGEGSPLRWIASGKTILNNKGKPVKQYEPYFSVDELGRPNHRFEEPREAGITPVIYYDAVGRVVRTELPDGTFSRVEFSPWHVASYDPNDTLLEPANGWHARRTTPTATVEDRRAARLAAEHAGTPAVVFLDSMAREVISVAHNRIAGATGALGDDKYLTFTKLDAEGKPLWIRDARTNLVMQYIVPRKATTWSAEPNEDLPAGSIPCYDVAGNLLFQHSMDAGDRWMINDAAGQPFYAWDVNDRVVDDGSTVREERVFHTTYDALRRPLERRLKINGGQWQVVERFAYGEGQPDDQERNLRGQLYQHYDPSALATNERFDFKGNLLESRRRLATAYQAPVIDWTEGSPTAALDAETFIREAEYDALSRLARLYNWHHDRRRVAVYEPHYNERGLLQREDLIVRARRTDLGYEGGDRTAAIAGIGYNEKGQRTRLRYGNGSITDYEYDPETFRLIRLRTTRRADATPLQDLRYTYDPVSNVTEIRDDAQQTVYFANTVVEPHCRYEYDALYRLVRAEGREHAAQNNVQRDGRDFESVTGIPFPNSPDALQRYTQIYDYDSAGNILRLQHVGGSAARWTRRYQYAGDSNRLLATSLPGDAADVFSARYAYDVHGSMLNLNRTPADYHLRWDYRDMIRHVNLGGGGQAWYNYDAGKQRTRKRIERSGSTIEERLYLGGMELCRRWSGTSLVEEIETHHLFADDQRVLVVDDVVVTDDTALGTGTLFRYQYGNHLGSVALELDADTAVISYEEYHPYGTAAYQAGGGDVRSTSKRYRYTGVERDEETGLSYHTARYYAAWLGRWWSADPIGISGGANVFRYSHDKPVKFSDVEGMQVPDPGAFGTFEEFRDAAPAVYREEYLYEAWSRYYEVQLERLLQYPNTSTVAPDPGEQIVIHPGNTLTTGDFERAERSRVPEPPEEVLMRSRFGPDELRAMRREGRLPAPDEILRRPASAERVEESPQPNPETTGSEQARLGDIFVLVSPSETQPAEEPRQGTGSGGAVTRDEARREAAERQAPPLRVRVEVPVEVPEEEAEEVEVQEERSAEKKKGVLKRQIAAPAGPTAEEVLETMFPEGMPIFFLPVPLGRVPVRMPAGRGARAPWRMVPGGA